MPIKGLTDRQPEFPEIGQLRKGGEKQVRKRADGSTYETWGTDLDHFRFTSEIPEAQAAFDAAYDGKPRMINVFLPFCTAEENFEAWQEEYVAGGLVHRCDGETMVLWLDNHGEYHTTKQPCPYESGKKPRTKQRPGCKPTGRLKVIIPELKRLAYVTVLTNSVHDIINLSKQLQALQSLQNDLRGIPLQLRRSLKTISTPGGDSKRVRRQKWLLSIEAAPKWVDLQLTAQQVAALPQIPEATPQLPANVTIIDQATGEIVSPPDDWDEGTFESGEDDVEEAEVSEEEVETPQKPANGKKQYTRPLDADDLRDVIREKAGWHGSQRASGEIITEKQVPYLATLMSELFPNLDAQMQKKARYDVLNFLIGVTSTKDLSKAEASALIDWCIKDPDLAAQEAARVLTAIAVEQGQQELPL